MKFLKQIFSSIIVLIILLSTIGINLTTHTCSSCNIKEEKIGFISTVYQHQHNINNQANYECTATKDCCNNKHFLVSHSKINHNTHSCCDFQIIFLKIDDIFSPSEFIKIFINDIFYFKLDFNSLFPKIFNFSYNLFNLPLKILDSKLILDFTCKLIL